MHLTDLTIGDNKVEYVPETNGMDQNGGSGVTSATD